MTMEPILDRSIKETVLEIRLKDICRICNHRLTSSLGARFIDRGTLGIRQELVMCVKFQVQHCY